MRRRMSRPPETFDCGHRGLSVPDVLQDPGQHVADVPAVVGLPERCQGADRGPQHRPVTGRIDRLAAEVGQHVAVAEIKACRATWPQCRWNTRRNAPLSRDQSCRTDHGKSMAAPGTGRSYPRVDPRRAPAPRTGSSSKSSSAGLGSRTRCSSRFAASSAVSHSPRGADGRLDCGQELPRLPGNAAPADPPSRAGPRGRSGPAAISALTGGSPVTSSCSILPRL